MKITFKFSPIYITLLDQDSIQLDLPDESSLKDAVTKLRELVPALFPEAEYAMYFVNNQFVPYPETKLTDGSVVQIMPPISGG